MHWKRRFHWLRREDGADLVEYALVLALIGVAVAAALSSTGDSISQTLQAAGEALNVQQDDDAGGSDEATMSSDENSDDEVIGSNGESDDDEATVGSEEDHGGEADRDEDDRHDTRRDARKGKHEHRGGKGHRRSSPAPVEPPRIEPPRGNERGWGGWWRWVIGPFLGDD